MTEAVEGLEKLRCFVAARPGDAIGENVKAVLQELRSAAERAGLRVSWTRPESWHLTLKFLGDVERERIGAVAEALAPVAAAATPIAVRATGLMALPERGRPQVVAVRLADDGSLARLAGAVDAALATLGFAVESRGFLPHMTLGRVRRAAGRGPSDRRGRGGALGAAVAQYAQRYFGDGVVGAVELMSSRLDPGGAVHERLAAFELGARAVW